MSKFKNKFFSSSPLGISLIEAMVTIAILLIGIMAIIKIFPLALKISASAEQATVATNLAQAKIEEMFFLDYGNIAIGAIEAKHRLASNPADPFYYYQRQTVSEYIDSNFNHSIAETGLKKITTTVYWQSPTLGVEKNLNLIIVISQK